MAGDVPDFQKIIDGLTIDQKVGQMYMGNICGGETVEFAKRNFEKHQLGALQWSGVFERFIRGGDYLGCGLCRNNPVDQVAELIFNVKKVGEEITGVPVIMAGDMEGAISNSILRQHYYATMPLPMGLGAAGDLENAYWAAKVPARESKITGLDMLYGPCLDVMSRPANPEVGARSFSNDPEVIAAMCEQFIKAYREENIISNVKHFPGRGFGATDAHHDLETIGESREDMLKTSVYPFARAIAAGVDSFMVAHTLYPAFETERLPASLSPRIMTDLLRKELGFEGMIIPDDLSMFAISKNFPLAEVPAMCLYAGADMVFLKVPEMYEPCMAAIKRYMREGKLTEERVNQSLLRILKLKHKIGLFGKKEFNRQRVLDTVGCKQHMEVATKAAQRAVTVARNSNNTLPLKLDADKSILVVVQRDMTIVMANDEKVSYDMLPRALGRHYANVQCLVVDETPTTAQAYEVLGRAKNVDAVVFNVCGTGVSQTYADAIKSILELKKPSLAVVTSSPYVTVLLPQEIDAMICTFGNTPFAFNAVADVIAGKAKATGTMPKLSNGSSALTTGNR